MLDKILKLLDIYIFKF